MHKRAFVQVNRTMPAIYSVPPQPRKRTSEVLLELAGRCREQHMTLRMLTDRLGDRTFGILLIVIAAFNVIPFVSTVSGSLVALLGIQMLLGVKRAWLPARFLDWQLPQQRAEAALLLFADKVRAMETFVRPRWQFTEAPVVDRLNGLIIAALGILIALPIPFTNLGPALVIVLTALGLLERDGVVQVAAMLTGVTTMIGIYLLLANGF